MTPLFADLLAYCVYAEDQSSNKKKLKYLHLIINIIRFNSILVSRNESSAEALI